MKRTFITVFAFLALSVTLVSCTYENSVNDSLMPYLAFSPNGDGTASVRLRAGFSVKEITIPPYVDLGCGILEVSVFNGCEDDKCASSVTAIVFPKTLTSYASGAFEGLHSLQNVSFSEDASGMLTWDGLLGRTIEKQGYDFEGWQCNGHMIQPGDRICDYPVVAPVFSSVTI